MCDTPSSKLKNIPYRLGLQTFAMRKHKIGSKHLNIVTFLVEKIVLIYIYIYIYFLPERNGWPPLVSGLKLPNMRVELALVRRR